MRYIFSIFRFYKFKTALIFLLSLVSIVSMMLIGAIGNGLVDMYASMLKTDGDIIVTQKGVADTFFSDVNISLMDEIAKIDRVKGVSAVIVGAGAISKIPIAGIYGMSENRIKKYKLLKGTFPKRGEVMIGENIQRLLSSPKNVEIFANSYKVSGVYKSKIGFENGGVIMPIKDASKIFKKDASFFLVSVDKKIEDINIILKKIQKLTPLIEAKTTDSFIDNYNQFKIIKITSLVISSISFLMGVLAIASILSIMVYDRRYEFGIKRALGISKASVIFSVVFESVAIVFISFLFSLVLADFILYLLKHIDKFQGYISGDITLSLILYSGFGVLAMGILGSLIPAWIAAKTDPMVLILRG